MVEKNPYVASFTALFESSDFSEGILQYGAVDKQVLMVVSPRVFDAAHELLGRLTELRRDGHDTTETLCAVAEDIDALPYDVARRQKVIELLVTGVREEIAANGIRIERALTAWRKKGNPGGPDAGRKIVAERQAPLYAILTGLLQRPEISMITSS